MLRRFSLAMVFLCIVFASGIARSQEPLRLENGKIGLSFDRKTGVLTALENKLTAETYEIQGDEFDIEAVEFHAAFADLKLLALDRQGDAVTARYECQSLAVEACYTLRGESHFAEKRITLTGGRKYGLKNVVVSRSAISAPELRVVDYRALAACVFFGRTPKGGFFAGMEDSFDGSSAKENEIILRLEPSLKVAAGEKIECEPAYFGVYRRGPHDAEEEGLPLRSESDAMVAMTSAILGPPRFGFMPLADGWCSEMHQTDYAHQPLIDGEVKEFDDAGRRNAEESDLKALEAIAQCGIDNYGDSHPWGGVSADAMSGLGPNDHYEPLPSNQKFLKRAEQLGIKPAIFVTLNNSHAWWKGKPFRPDRPDWLLDAGASPPESAPPWRKTTDGIWRTGGNCLGVREFMSWLERINLEAMAKNPYPMWGMDGDFFGGGGAIVPADCQSDKHDHLPGNSNYACQRALTRLFATMREHYPQAYLAADRPPMDLGVWSLRNVDACLPINELGTSSDNVAGGNQIRQWGRIRVQRHFFPHYIDQPQLFPVSPDEPYPPPTEKWPQGNFDYILLSALSTSPNLLFYLPLKSGFPDADKAEIKKWIEWGRANAEYLKVRKDLPDWPAADTIDGSAHLVGDRGLIFLFNPSQKTLTSEFALTEESIGLKAAGNFLVTQEYPPADRKIVTASGQSVHWEVPPTTPLVLRIRPDAP